MTIMSLFSFLNITFPLFFSLLLSWVSSTTPPPSNSNSPSQTLRINGYSLFASAIESAISQDGWNASGTLLATPDFAFKNGRALHRPTSMLLNYHTLLERIDSADLTARLSGSPFSTHSYRRCVFKCAGEACFTGSKKPASEYVRVRQPDLYSDENLVVHGVDGVLNPFSADRCRGGRVTRGDLVDLAVRVFRRKGFGVAATEMAMRKSDLVSLTAVTVFAPRDDGLFGGRYDFRYHVVPRRLRLVDLDELTEMETLIDGEKLVVMSVDGDVRVNGVLIDGSEVYQSKWISILAVKKPLQKIYNADSTTVSHHFDANLDVLSDSGGVELALLSADSPIFGEFDDLDMAPVSFSDEEIFVEPPVESPAPPAFLSIPVDDDDVVCSPALSPTSDFGNGNGPVSALSVGLEPYCPIGGLRNISSSVSNDFADVATSLSPDVATYMSPEASEIAVMESLSPGDDDGNNQAPLVYPGLSDE